MNPRGVRHAQNLGAGALALATPTTAQNPTAPRSLAELSRGLSAVAARVEPAVVEIRATAYASDADAPSAEALLQRQRRGGSGVVVSENGHIVTNLHVVDGARRLVVVLPVPAADTPGQSGSRSGARSASRARSPWGS